MTLARNYAQRALALDGTESRAHGTLAHIHSFNRNWSAFLQGLDRVYALNPSDRVSVTGAAVASFYRGDIDRGISLYRRAIELNPADAANMWSFAEALYATQRWETAREQAQTVVRRAPDAAFGYAVLAKVLSQIGEVELVRSNATAAESRNPGLFEFVDIALAYQRIDDIESARRIFKLAGAGDLSTTPNPGWQFWMHMAIEDYDAAITFLERAIAENFPSGAATHLHYLSEHPDYDPIRSHPKFNDVVKTVSQPLQGKDAV